MSSLTTSHTTAANHLSEPSERGTLGLAYRRSVMALSNIFGYKTSTTESEREPLLNDHEHDSHNATTSGQAETSYGSVLDLPPERRVPKPKAVKSPVRVEAKVWFANERTWISWLRVSLLIGSFAVAMYNSAGYYSSNPPEGDRKTPYSGTIRNFAIVYALISILTLSWGLFNYHRRLYLIRTKHAGDFSDMIGPPVICAVLFVAVLVNFIVRVQEHNFGKSL